MLIPKIVDNNTDDQLAREAPYNSMAEQSILGSFLINNEHINKVSDMLLSDHFYVPVHRKIYEAILRFQERGVVANPITLKSYFNQDESLVESGVDGYGYMIALCSAAASITSVESLARTIYALALRRGLISISELAINQAYDNKIDLSSEQMIENAEQNLFNLSSSGLNNSNLTSLRQSLIGSLHKISELKKRGGRVNGVTSGFERLDEILGGLQSSDLLILAARPSMGKTSLAVNIAVNAAEAMAKESMENPKSVAFFSLEMSSEQITNRILAIKTQIDGTKIRSGMVSQQEFIKLSQGCSNISKVPLYLDDTPAITISALRTRARRMKRVHNLGLLVVDYLQLLRGSYSSAEVNRVNEIGEITQGLKAIAKELNIPVIALSQLSRAVELREDKRPQLSDLRESGNIEQDADVVMFIYRAEYYLTRKMPLSEEGNKFREWEEQMEQTRNMAEVIIAKQRNGPIGTVGLHFNTNTTGFANLDSFHE